jgi:predicted O-linked N-acetylglucosamine transferase (SPINDLY family)
LKKQKHRSPERTDPGPYLTRGLALQQGGDLAGAEACYREALRIAPGQPDALHLLGVIALRTGHPEDAARLITQAIEGAPGNPMFRVNLANALEAAGQADAAERALREAVRLQPGFAAAQHNLGNLLTKAERYDEAISCYDRAIVADPSHAAACAALGQIMLLHKRQPQVALQLAQRAVQARPDDRKGNELLVECLFRFQKHQAAMPVIEGMLARDPNHPEARAALAKCLAATGRVSESIAAYRRVVADNPGDYVSLSELGRNLFFSGELEEGFRLMHAAVQMAPDDRSVHSLRLFFLNYFDDQPPERVLDEHRRWESGVERGPGFSFPPAPDPARRLRIGYLSPDFKRHSVSFFVDCFLEHHDRSRFEVYAYYLSTETDPVTERVKGSADHFAQVIDLTPTQLARRLHDDGIDIAIDLAGHTSALALEALHQRPTPVQVTWLGYPHSTGLSSIDYRISDARADPPGVAEAWNSERLVRLPDCFHCYRPEVPVEFDPVPPSIKAARPITFGSFNVLSKISPQCIVAWSTILRQMPDSRLLLKTRLLGDASVRDRFLGAFAAQGIDLQRVELLSDQPAWADHVGKYRLVDIGLDPFPYAGATTTCEALWMGVPVVTLAGDRHVSRVGVSLLTAIGHPELVARDIDDYVRIAVELGRDSARLASLHAGLRPEMEASPLRDERRFVANLEAAYRTMWTDYCRAHH